MLSGSYTGKNAYSAGKTSGVLRGGASGANRCYVLAHCGYHPNVGKRLFPFFSKEGFTGKIKPNATSKGGLAQYIWAVH